MLSGLDPSVVERIHVLWDELAAFEAADSETALVHLLATVADIVRADNAYWMGAVRLTENEGDPLCGWRPRAIRYLRPLPNDEKFTQQRLRELNRGQVDELTVAHARLAGRYRASRMCDLVAPAWFEGGTYQGYVGRGVHDSLVVVAPVAAVAEGYYGFLRARPDDRFTGIQRDTALYAMRGLTWFHRQTMLAYGLLVARSPLTPAERRVLALLLSDKSEKEMAAQLDLSPSTLHTYVRDVLRKFGVSGRNGLISIWLGRQPERFVS
jgi:DNA-binding CsgD family transcriptional regulator